MSIKILENEIKRFLLSKEPEVSCIKGKWGVGKTYSWNYFISESVRTNRIGLKKYAYVSLFGLKSLNELRYAIFESTIGVSELTKGPNDSTLLRNFKLAKKNLRKVGGFLYRLPKVQSYIGLPDAALFLSVKNQIVCIDDLERAGAGLTTADVLGLISMMKEQRDCKVVLLLNEEALSEGERKTFGEQLEKVADVAFEFNPTPLEVADICFPEKHGIYGDLYNTCTTLQLVNIRVIKKIEKFALRLEEILGKDNPEVMVTVVHALTLICWSVYQPLVAPSADFLQAYNAYSYMMSDKKQSEQEQHWHNLLSAYRFGEFNELDQEILQGVKTGYFQEESLKKVAAQHSEWLLAQKGDNTFNKAWDLYHESFDDNQEELAELLYSGAIGSIKSVHLANLDSTVSILKELGKSTHATELIDLYMQKNPKMIEGYKAHRRVFDDLKDPELIATFKNNVEEETSGKRTVSTILIEIGAGKLYSLDDIEKLAAVGIEEFYQLFKQVRGDDKALLIKAVSIFQSKSQPDDHTRFITNRLLNSLKRIADENKLNARRVQQYIKIPDDLQEM